MRVRRSHTSTFPICFSSKKTVPDVGNILVANICRRVDLPAPLGPRTTHRSPGEITKFSGPNMFFWPRRTETSRSSKTRLLLIGDKRYIVIL